MKENISFPEREYRQKRDEHFINYAIAEFIICNAYKYSLRVRKLLGLREEIGQ